MILRAYARNVSTLVKKKSLLDDVTFYVQRILCSPNLLMMVSYIFLLYMVCCL